uniref:NADH dehydrogenase subunit 6 n=1 Tax=Xenophthalmus pinnotheroides TaxID=585961 RepID=UPI00202816AC|nr:NADH dehydrogenase subunit 6 [Xenophthalmus pinnotheroides]UPL64996.1 NADH dehydrogenase subunit 6 [Xenophthalmus pinnotheroides]
MLTLTIPLLMLLSILFTNLSHPLAMGLTLLTQTSLITITIGLVNFSFWFSYILFLVFLGGMLVLFIYVASLASNEAFASPSPLTITLMLMMLTISLMSLFMDPLVMNPPTSLPHSTTFNSISTPFIISWIYNLPSMTFTIFIMSYLLLMLVIVVKIVNLFKAPLRLMN